MQSRCMKHRGNKAAIYNKPASDKLVHGILFYMKNKKRNVFYSAVKFPFIILILKFVSLWEFTVFLLWWKTLLAR